VGLALHLPARRGGRGDRAAADRQTALDAAAAACVELRGQVLPVVSLRTLYALDGEAAGAQQRGRGAGRRRSATA
jgi:hypothetical protein